MSQNSSTSRYRTRPSKSRGYPFKTFPESALGERRLIGRRLGKGSVPPSLLHCATDANEMTNAVSHLGYTKEAHAAKVYDTEEAGTIPLYRLFSASAGDHFYTTSAGERDNAVHALGYKSEGVAAYIYKSQICGSVPLYRLYSPSATNHFYTISKDEANNAASKLGYANEGVVGYVLPSH